MPNKEVEQLGVGDGELAVRFKQGDRAALSAFAARYMDRAFYMALALLGNVEDARDAAQEAFLRAFKRRRTFDSMRPFLPWFYRILKNLCMDRLRVDSRWECNLEEVPLDLKEGSMDIETELERKELRAMVWRAILSLKPIHREIIILRHFEGLSYAELSEVLGISRGTVMSRLYHARSELRSSLADLLDEI